MTVASLILASADLSGVGNILLGIAAAGTLIVGILTAIGGSKNRGKVERQKREEAIRTASSIAAEKARTETKRATDQYVASLLSQIAWLQVELAAEQKDNAGHIDQLINLGQPPR